MKVDGLLSFIRGLISLIKEKLKFPQITDLAFNFLVGFIFRLAMNVV